VIKSFGLQVNILPYKSHYALQYIKITATCSYSIKFVSMFPKTLQIWIFY